MYKKWREVTRFKDRLSPGEEINMTATTTYRTTNNARRRTHSRIRINWNRIFMILTVIIFAMTFIKLATPQIENVADLANETGRIRYEYVNFRTQPDTGAKILDTIHEGASVTFTGNRIDYWLNEVTPAWVEVEYDGQIGWIVTESVTTYGY